MSTTAPRALCPRHVEDEVLRERIRTLATERYCSYCTTDVSVTPFAVRLPVFVDAFMVGVGVYYQPPPLASDPPRTSTIDSADVAREILEVAGVSHRGLIDDVTAALGHTPHWMPRDPKSGGPIEQLTYNWAAFKHLVKHEMRYFFSTRTTGRGEPGEMTAAQVLKAVSDLGENHPAVWPAPCPTPLFRARMATSEVEASGWRHAADIGPAPPELAGANRMSPAGISVFYGATDRTTAIAEAGAHAAH